MPSSGPHPRAARLAVVLAVTAVLVLLSVAFPLSGPGQRTGPAPSPVRPGSAFEPSAGDTGSASGSAAPVFDWTAFHGSDNRSGYSPVGGPLDPTGGWFACPSGWAIRSGPVATATRVYVADYFGTVYALDRAHNGSEVWNRSLGSTPTQLELAGSMVLVGTAAGELFALDAGTGVPVWSRVLPAAGIQSALVLGTTVYLPTANGAVVAVALASGAPVAQFSLPGPPAGALATDGARLYAATSSGEIVALSPSGATIWTASVGSPVASAPAVAGGQVVVGTLGGTVASYDAGSGDLRWRTAVASASSPQAIRTTPAVGDGEVFVATDADILYALSLSSGTPVWTYSTLAVSVPYESAPAVSPNGVYLVDNGVETLDAVAPATGKVLWTSSLFTYSNSDPAVSSGQVIVGTEGGCVLAFGSLGGPRWPVRGTVTDPAGAPLTGATVQAGPATATTAANGSFELGLANGTYAVSVTALLRNPLTAVLSVHGPTAGLRFVLTPLTVYSVSGVVVDADSGHGIAGTRVSLDGAWGYSSSVVTGSSGAFRLSGPNGTDGISVAPPSGFAGIFGSVEVRGAAVATIVLRLTPVDLAPATADPLGVSVWLPIATVASATGAIRALELVRRRTALGLPPRLLSPFGRFVVMRLLLLPGQVTALATLVFVFEFAVPGGSVWSGCGAPGPPAGASFWVQYGVFLHQLYTGQWGCATLGNFSAPVANVFAWWLPQSIELAAFGLLFALAFAYPIGLWAGWRAGGATDRVVRAGSLVGLLTPTFVLALGLLVVLYPVYLHGLGDEPYGMLPSIFWFGSHGGVPSWIGSATNTSPTGFPLIDGALHGDWGFERLTLAKTALQALVVAVVYVTIFLRYARHVVAESARELHVLAGRARGISESRLLWRHTARRVLPFYALVFGLTLPAYVGTQALVEALFGDFSVGALLFFDAVNSPIFTAAVFLLIVVVLVGTLAADIVARYLDPRFLRRPV
jgi:peptide/nickel transport system permease protein